MSFRIVTTVFASAFLALAQANGTIRAASESEEDCEASVRPGSQAVQWKGSNTEVRDGIVTPQQNHRGRERL